MSIESLVATRDSLFANAWVEEDRKSNPIGGVHVESSEDYEALFRSTDDGDNWTLLNWEHESNNAGDSTFLDVILKGETLFACTWHGVFRLSSLRQNWIPVNSGLAADEGDQALPLVTALTLIGDKLFAGTWDGVYVSADNGENWTAANSGLPENTDVHSIVVSDSTLYASLGALESSITR